MPQGPKYTTKLSPEEEKEFSTWYGDIAKKKGLHPNPDGQHYDYRGFWKEGLAIEGGDAHFVDTYKQPGHPTFSTESIYSSKETPGGNWSKDESGTWFFKHSPYTEKHVDKTREYLKGSGEYSITTKGDTLDIPNVSKMIKAFNSF